MSEERTERKERNNKRSTDKPVMKTFTVFCDFGDGRLSEMVFSAPTGFTARDVNRFQQRLEEREGVNIYRKPKFNPNKRRDNNYSKRRGGYDD